MKETEFVSGCKLVNEVVVGTEEVGSGLSIQERVLKSPCKTGPPGKLLPGLCSEGQRLWEAHPITAMVRKPPGLLLAPWIYSVCCGPSQLNRWPICRLTPINPETEHWDLRYVITEKPNTSSTEFAGRFLAPPQLSDPSCVGKHPVGWITEEIIASRESRKCKLLALKPLQCRKVH